MSSPDSTGQGEAQPARAERSFSDLGLDAPILKALKDVGYETPSAIQAATIPSLLAGRDVVGRAQTGTGKTAAFALPILSRLDLTQTSPQALVLAPTRELASQIVEESRAVAHARALSVAAVYGGVGLDKQARAARRAHIVVATPGRLIDLLDRGALTLDHVRILVLDEADRMLDMGFRPAVDRIVDATPRDRQTLFFSATLHGEVGRIANEYTRDARRHEHAPPPERAPDIEHRFVAVEHAAKLDRLVRELDSSDDARTLVFVRTKRGADRLVKRLRGHRVEAAAMHGNKSQAQREKALARFEAGRIDTLVATDVAARGIDVEGITHVINFDAPADDDGYTHRIGRTGRAGRAGVGITFVLPDQARDAARMAVALGLKREFERSGLAVDRADHTGPRSNGGGQRSNGGGQRSNGGGSRRAPQSRRPQRRSRHRRQR